MRRAGLGIGAGLVGECIRFARETRYRKIRLRTHSILTAVRSIYRRAPISDTRNKALGFQ